MIRASIVWLAFGILALQAIFSIVVSTRMAHTMKFQQAVIARQKLTIEHQYQYLMLRKPCALHVEEQ